MIGREHLPALEEGESFVPFFVLSKAELLLSLLLIKTK